MKPSPLDSHRSPGSVPQPRAARRARRARLPRKPGPGRFAATVIDLPAGNPDAGAKGPWYLLAAMAGGILVGAFWPQQGDRAEPEADLYVMEEAPPPQPIKPPPPEPPPPPPPPKVKAVRVPVPEKQFGLQKEALAEKSDLAVATGNTVNAKADSIIAPPPPALPPEPVLIDQPPKVVSGKPPEYPARARDRGQEGTVVALITIDTSGLVIRAKVEKSAGTDFDNCVLKSVWATRFQAPIHNGRRVPTMFRRPYEFRLDG